VAPTAGQTLLGRYRVEALSEPFDGLVVGTAVEAGGSAVTVVAVPGAFAEARDVGAVLSGEERYRIGAVGIARPLGAELVDGWLVAVYERRHSETLTDAVARGPSAPAAIGHALSGLAAALGPLHDQGIAFGILRPDLIRVGPEGVSVEGFALDALVRAVLGGRAAAELVPAALRAPENAGAASAPPSPAADAHAVGAIATELVVGRRLSATDAHPTPRACGTDVSDEVEAAIAKAVAHSPLARPTDLVRWADELAVALARPHAPLAPSPPPRPAELSEAPAPPWDAPPAPEPAAAPPAGPAPVPRPAPPPPAFRHDSAPPSGRRRDSALPLIALIVGALLMVGGVAGLFAYAQVRETPVSASATAGAAGGAGAPAVGPAPPPPVEPPEPPAEDDSGAAGSPPEPDASAPLPPVGVRIVSQAEAGALLPVPADVPVWGVDRALVTIVLFADLECPHTRRALLGLTSMLRAFPKDVRVAFRHRPLAIHSRARDAARVAAGLRRDLGDAAFWSFVSAAARTTHDANKLELAKWVEQAGGQGTRVEQWLEDPTTEHEVARDLVLAGMFDVRETPTFFVNGLRVDGFAGYADLERVVARELASARSVLALGTAAGEVYATRVRKNLVGLGKDVAERTCPAVGSSPSRGAAEPLVTLVEFSDFECPFCGRVQPALDTLLARHGGDLRIVWKNFPLDHHPRARPAAAFALEVLERGGPTKFWKAHDLLFAAQKDLGDDALTRIAGELALPAETLVAASRSRARDPKIDADARMGLGLGVRGTPAFFINGRVLNGAQPVERFEAVIREELESARGLVSGGTPRARVYDALCGVR
jgi:protein-disulfide isomerase